MATDRREQKKLRRRRGERAFIFDKEVKHELGAVDREDWESAVVLHGGRVDAAAETCGLTGVPPDAKQFWGKSAEEARSNYVGWRRKRKKQVSQGPRHKRMKPSGATPICPNVARVLPRQERHQGLRKAFRRGPGVCRQGAGDDGRAAR